MESSFQVFLTKLLTSTCAFIFQNLSSHYVVGIRFYHAPVRNTVKTCNPWLLPHITIQPLTPVVNPKGTFNSRLYHISNHKEDIYISYQKSALCLLFSLSLPRLWPEQCLSFLSGQYLRLGKCLEQKKNLDNSDHMNCLVISLLLCLHICFLVK